MILEDVDPGQRAGGLHSVKPWVTRLACFKPGLTALQPVDLPQTLLRIAPESLSSISRLNALLSKLRLHSRLSTSFVGRAPQFSATRRHLRHVQVLLIMNVHYVIQVPDSSPQPESLPQGQTGDR